MVYDYMVEINTEHGCVGMRPLFLENSDPARPLQATHDLLEHFPENINSNTELQALGAMLYVRGLGGYFRPYKEPTAALEADLGFVTKNQSIHGIVTEPPVTKILSDRVEAWITKSIVGLYKELEVEGFDISSLDKSYSNWLKGWLRIGYRRAQIRYADLDPALLTVRFLEIEKRLTAILKWAECGDLIRIKLTRSTMEYSIQLISWYDSEHPNFVTLGD